MDTIHIDKGVALGGLVGAIEMMGEGHIYRTARQGSCLYWHAADQVPGCIVGHVLNGLGVQPETLMEMDAVGAIALRDSRQVFDGPWSERDCTGPGPEMSAVLTRAGVEIDLDAADVLLAAQEVQDVGKPWGEALAAAQEKYAKHE